MDLMTYLLARQYSGGGGGGGDLPEVTTEDNGKILSVVKGSWDKSDINDLLPIVQKNGEIGNELILSSLDDGLYAVTGEHRITADSYPIYSSSSNIIVIVQTINEKKVIRRITADELTTYKIENGVITTNEVATKEYLEQAGYATEDYVDAQLEVLEAELKTELEDYIDENIQPVDNSDIQDLF